MKKYLFLAAVLLAVSATTAYAGLFSFGAGAGFSGFGTSNIASPDNAKITDDDQARAGAIDTDKNTPGSDASSQQQTHN